MGSFFTKFTMLAHCAAAAAAAALVSMLNAPLGLTVGSLANVITFHLTFPHWWCSSDSYSGVISGHSMIQSPSRFIAIHSDLFYNISYGIASFWDEKWTSCDSFLANVTTFHLTFPHWWCSSNSYSGVIGGHSMIQSPSRFIAIHSDLFWYGK